MDDRSYRQRFGETSRRGDASLLTNATCLATESHPSPFSLPLSRLGVSCVNSLRASCFCGTGTTGIIALYPSLPSIEEKVHNFLFFFSLLVMLG